MHTSSHCYSLVSYNPYALMQPYTQCNAIKNTSTSMLEKAVKLQSLTHGDFPCLCMDHTTPGTPIRSLSHDSHQCNECHQLNVLVLTV